MFRGFNSHFQTEQFSYLAQIKSYRHYKQNWLPCEVFCLVPSILKIRGLTNFGKWRLQGTSVKMEVSEIQSVADVCEQYAASEEYLRLKDENSMLKDKIAHLQSQLEESENEAMMAAEIGKQLLEEKSSLEANREQERNAHTARLEVDYPKSNILYLLKNLFSSLDTINYPVVGDVESYFHRVPTKFCFNYIF